MGRDVVYVASTEEDAQFLELVRVGCALAAYGARRRIFVIPFMGYSTMERQVRASVCVCVCLCSVCVCVSVLCVCACSVVCAGDRARMCVSSCACVYPCASPYTRAHSRLSDASPRPGRANTRARSRRCSPAR